MSAEILSYGGIIHTLNVPNRGGETINVVLNYEDPEAYLNDKFYLNAIIGRYANRISNGRFSVEGKKYVLANNLGKNHLHGGINGFNSVLWEVEKVASNKLELQYTSPHMDEGYPGNLTIKVNYTITEENELVIDYQAITDQSTVLNLTNHAYFNLSGGKEPTIKDHVLSIYSDTILAVDADLIPTGEYIDVKGTVFDFTFKRILGSAINNNAPALQHTKGYDHCYVFEGENLKPMAKLESHQSGIVMTTYSTEPGMQLYTGNHLLAPFQAYAGACLETQHYPDSPNKPSFPATTLEPDQEFSSKTVYKFESEY